MSDDTKSQHIKEIKEYLEDAKKLKEDTSKSLEKMIEINNEYVEVNDINTEKLYDLPCGEGVSRAEKLLENLDEATFNLNHILNSTKDMLSEADIDKIEKAKSIIDDAPEELDDFLPMTILSMVR